MTIVSPSPVAIQDFFINGVPAVGGKLFVYAAGTTTKITTYTDSTGSTPQTNPVILNARGEPENSLGASVGLWVPTGVPYKLVFTTPTDTDPPTTPIWTVDNLISQSLSAAIVSVASVSAMEALTGTPLANGQVIYLEGYTAANDGGQGIFLVTTTNPGTVDNGLIFASNTSGFWFVRQWDGLTAYPEWWNAPLINTGTNALPALQAAVTAAPIVQLLAGVYTITSTWKIQTNWRLVRGALPDASGSGTATQINLNSATLDICQVGPNSQPTPNSTANFLGFIYLQHLTFNRTTAPTPPSSGFGGPSGLRCQWLTSCHFDDIWCNQNTNGFYITGTVFCKFNECHAYRNVAGTTSTNDYYCGFLQDNSATIGLNSGNASIYYDYCGAVATSTPAYSGMTVSYGIYTIGGFADTFVFKFESSQMSWGAIFNGTSGSIQYASENLHVTEGVWDSCAKGGLVISGGVNTNVQAVFSGNYCAPVAGNGVATYGFSILNTSGAVSLVGNQIISNATSNDAVGIYIYQSSGVVTKGNVITDVAAPIVLSTGNNCHLSDLINVTAAGGVTGLAGVVLLSSNRNIVDVTLKCSAAGNYYTYGVDMEGALNAYNEIRMSGLDPAALNSTSANKLISNGTQITSTGTFSTNNLAQGITA